MSSDKITQLQTKITYQEDSIEELGAVVIMLQKQVDQLELRCQSLEAKMGEMASLMGGVSGENEIPPHY